MPKLGRDYTPVGPGDLFLHPREVQVAVGVLASINAEAVITADGCATVTLDVRGTYVGTFAVEGSADGINWTAIPMRLVNGAAISYFITAASGLTGVFVGQVYGYRLVRVRMVAYTSGNPDFVLTGHINPFNDATVGLVTTSITTALSASGVAQTLTIPAPGVGLRQYLTYLSINRFAAAALTASGTPTAVTTTNLPGSLAITLSSEAAAQGALLSWREDFAYPIAGSAQNTAMTIVCPATTGVIWRVTAGYYLAP